MKSLMLLALAFSFLLNETRAQNFSREFGNISQDELEMQAYSRDETAEAVVLYDIGKSYFEIVDDQFVVVFERSQKIKILSDAGIDWGEFTIPLYQEGGIYETLVELEGASYNLTDGVRRKTGLNPENVYDEKINQYWTAKKFAMPEVKAGSVIEIKYKIRSQYLFNLRDWEFQARIPTVYSEYEVSLVPFYEYSYLVQGISKFYAQTSKESVGLKKQYGPVSYTDMIHKFVMMYVPGFKDEEYITTINDYIMKIDFQLATIHNLQGVAIDYMSTWPDLIKELEKSNDFGRYIERSAKLSEDIIISLNLSQKTDEEKFNIILDYAKSNFNWDGAYGRYASKTSSDFLKTGFGNCADINLFVVGMLREAGIEAYAVWSSTRENGKIKYDYPFTSFFNYVLIALKLEDNFILSDATEVLSANYRIPYRCINDKGLVIKKDVVEWVDLQCNFPSVTNQNFNISFEDNEMIAKVENSFSEYDALINRKQYSENNEKIIESLQEEGYEVIDSSVKTINHQNITEPYYINYSVINDPEIINNKIYVLPFLNDCLEDNPLTALTRTYPVDMNYPRKRSYSSTILVPEGYKVDFLPVNYEVNNDIFELKYLVLENNHEINISFTYYFKKGIYQPSEYSKVKSYFSDIIKKGNEKIVLAPVASN